MLVLVLIGSLALAACGDDEGNGDEGGSDNGDSVSLSQTFESSEGVSVKYPEDWAAAEDAGQILVANSTEGLELMQATDSTEGPSEGQVGMVFMAVPAAGLGMGEDATISAVFDMMLGAMTVESMETVGESEEMTIAGNDALKQNVRDAETESEGFVIGYIKDDGTVVLLIGLTASGERDEYDDIAVDIAASVETTAPAADAAE